MKKTFVKTAAACGLCLTLLVGGASAAYQAGVQNRMGDNQTPGQQTALFGGQQGAQTGGMFGQMQNGTAASTVSSPTTIAAGLTTNSAAALEADYTNAETITMSESNSSVKIKSAGTYIVTGTCSDGSITVTKGTTGVVLVLKDLDLASSTGAALAINKNAEVKVVVSGSVTLTDNEDPADETSADADVADAYDGAAIKVKAGASAYITGAGVLTVNGSAKNGIKAGDDTALVIDGPTVSITAVNDGINGSYDVAILSGKLTVSAGDDAIHADRILSVGANGSGPSITIKSCTEGLEGTVVNLTGGTVNVTSTDDGVNAANSDGTYASELAYAINVTGASVTVNAPRADGLDSNGNINLVSGSATISSASNGGDAGLDYDGSLYISKEFALNNQSGVTSMGGGMMGGMAPVQGQQGLAGGQFDAQGRQSPNQGMNQMPMQNISPAQNQQGVMGDQFGAPGRAGNQMQGGMGMNQQFGIQNQMGNPGIGQPMQGMMGGMSNGQNAQHMMR